MYYTIFEARNKKIQVILLYFALHMLYLFLAGERVVLMSLFIFIPFTVLVYICGGALRSRRGRSEIPILLVSIWFFTARLASGTTYVVLGSVCWAHHMLAITFFFLFCSHAFITCFLARRYLPFMFVQGLGFEILVSIQFLNVNLDVTWYAIIIIRLQKSYFFQVMWTLVVMLVCGMLGVGIGHWDAFVNQYLA